MADQQIPEPAAAAPAVPELPIEMWAHILSNLGDPRDQNRVCHVNAQFNGIMATEKGNFQFPLVLPMLINNMSASDILKCRLVSKTWKKSVDYLLEYGPHYRTKDQDKGLVDLSSIPTNHPIFTDVMISFTNHGKITRFLTTMSNNAFGANPFPGRSVRFSVTTRNVGAEDVALFEDKMRTFLARFGRHIWRFQYKLPMNGNPFGGRDMLIRILQNLNNLKTIQFEEGYEWLHVGFMMVPRGRLVDVGEMLPFPELPNLVGFLFPPRITIYQGNLLLRFLNQYRAQLKVINFEPIEFPVADVFSAREWFLLQRLRYGVAPEVAWEVGAWAENQEENDD